MLKQLFLLNERKNKFKIEKKYKKRNFPCSIMEVFRFGGVNLKFLLTYDPSN